MEKSLNVEEWNRQRRMGIGGSDIGAICGLNKWRTALDVFLEKTGQSQEKEPNEAMRLGTFLEPYIVSRYEEATGLKCVEQEGMYHDGCIVCNVDRIVDMGDGRTQVGQEIVSSRILECKTARYEWEDGVPLAYQCQVQWYMGAFQNVKECDVAVFYTGGQKEPFHIFKVAKDNEIYENLKERAIEFWNKYVLTGTMPPPQTEDDARLIWAKHHEGESKFADAVILSKFKELLAKDEELEAIEDARAKIITDIMKFMGNAEVLKDAGGQKLVSWKNQKDSVKVDWKSLATSLHATDAQVKRYTTVKAGARVFRYK